ncbi:MAG: histidine phosphatase family protein, partial [Myxococcota bacterium]
MTQFWLIRHAQSRSNAGFPTEGHTRDIPLTVLGHQQAERVAEFFDGPPSLIVHSPYLRAQQTAEPTMRRFAHVPHDVWFVQEFTYVKVEGPSTWEERTPLIESYWNSADPHQCAGKGFESFAELLDRIDVFIAQLRSCQAERVLVFSHCRFIQVFFWSWLVGRERAMETMQTFWETRHLIRVPNTGYIRGQVMDDGALALAPIATI